MVMAVNPYMIRYATEARMYSLQILLVACGLVVVPRACERPSFGRLGSVALVTALLVYTHYWSFSLVGVTLGAVLFVSWRRTRAPAPVVAGRRVDRRRTARVPAVVADVPLPTRAHRDPVGRRHPSRHPDRQHVARLLGWGGAGGLGARVRAGRTRPRRRVRACGGRATARSRHPRATVGARARRRRGSDACHRHQSRLPRRTGVPVALQRGRVPVLRTSARPRARGADGYESADRCARARGRARVRGRRAQRGGAAHASGRGCLRARRRRGSRRSDRVLPRSARPFGAPTAPRRLRRDDLSRVRATRVRELGRLPGPHRGDRLRRVRERGRRARR